MSICPIFSSKVMNRSIFSTQISIIDTPVVKFSSALIF